VLDVDVVVDAVAVLRDRRFPGPLPSRNDMNRIRPLPVAVRGGQINYLYFYLWLILPNEPNLVKRQYPSGMMRWSALTVGLSRLLLSKSRRSAARGACPTLRTRRRNRETGGVCLGLPIAIIRAHGGQISLRNPPEGGLEVMVRLPAVGTRS
jgi:hypothetical protein